MVAYLLNAIAEIAPPEAAPVLMASLRRRPTAQVLRTLAFIDHPETVPAIAEHLDGELRTDALISLEQLASRAALDLLAARAASGDIDCARALARHRDHRAFEPLAAALNGREHRSAVTGLSDLRHEEALPLLRRIVAEDTDDDVATIAAHGIVMAAPALASDPVRTLARRKDPDVRALSAHWLTLLG
jgi:HEAT repeat protein